MPELHVSHFIQSGSKKAGEPEVSPEPETTPDRPRSNKPEDLEVKDAQLIFNSVWQALEDELGRENLIFPQEISWLGGAPGAGKGTQTPFIMKYRDLTAEPIVVSSLLKSPEAQKLIDAGLMVGDREVVELLFRQLLKPEYKSGALVDGFPRTIVQVECLKLLYNKLRALRQQYQESPQGGVFPKPHFHIIILFVDEAESVERQLKRGRMAQEAQKRGDTTGIELPEVRKTDLDPEAARNRYRTFKNQTYRSLKSLRELFHYHFIDAKGTIEEVRDRIIRELAYQSSLELDHLTYDIISQIPIASQLVVHARQELVKRMDNYAEHHADLFRRLIEVIQKKFIPIIQRHAITGMAMVNSEDTLFENPTALAMLLDIFSERGYHATVDVRREHLPEKIDLESGEIQCRVQKVYRFVVRFQGSEIRRGD